MFFLKSSNFHKPKKLIHLFVLLILLVYCKKERNNPWDDKNTLKKDSWMVDNLKIDIFKIDSINLAWELKNDKIEGVRIGRKIDEQPWVTNYAQVPNNILNFTDTAVNLLNHKYHYRLYAYAGNNLSSFIDTIVPKVNLPTINTTSITSISTTSAVSGGNITNDGGSTITQRGVCWSITPNPTISNDKTNNGSGSGSFTSNLTGLSANTTYYVRAYATNIAGSSYGNEVSFTTEQILPVLTTNSITSITGTSAISGGNITNDGGVTITQRGVCWSTSPNPTILNDKTINGEGKGNFSSNLTGLSLGVTYYVRAYAINTGGTAYGNQLSFTTTYQIGDTGPAGGYIFYDKGNYDGGWRYLEAAPTDQSTGNPWGCYGTAILNTQTIVSSGKQNTAKIIAGCSQSNIASKICDDLILGGKDDWFLPSLDELKLMYNNLHLNNLGNFKTYFIRYWSSTESDYGDAWHFSFDYGDANSISYSKSEALYVRAVRAF